MVKLCIGMIDAGKAYVSANKQFVSGIRELAQQSAEDEVIEVRDINSVFWLVEDCWFVLYHSNSPRVFFVKERRIFFSL